VRRNYEVYLISYVTRKHFIEIPKEIANIEGLRIIHRKFNFTQEYRFLFPTMVFDFWTLIRKIKPDILHSGFVR